MDITTLAAWGEFLGGIAVVVSLIYLAGQIRNSTRSNEISNHQNAQAQLSKIHELVMGNRELSELAASCRDSSLGGLSPGNEERIRRLANYYVNAYSSVEMAYKQGQFERRGYESYCQDLRRTLNDYPALAPYMRAVMDNFDRDWYGVFKPLYE